MRLKFLLSLLILIGFTYPANADSSKTLKKLESHLFNGNSIEEIIQLCRYDSEGKNCDRIVESLALGDIELIRALAGLEGILISTEGEKKLAEIEKEKDVTILKIQKDITKMQINHQRDNLLFQTFSQWGLLFPFYSQ